MRKPENQIILIFGASGDLTKRKLVPSLYDLYDQNLMPDKFAIIGASRSDLGDANYRNEMKEGIIKFALSQNKEKIDDFLNSVFYQSVDAKSIDSFLALKNRLQKIMDELQVAEKIIFYLSTPPSLYSVIPENLAKVELNNEQKGWKRIIIEKPFGYNLETAKELNASLKLNWKENQIYRIDHYLGKETVQNVLVTRFSNGIFEPLWNRNYIDHIEITSAESIGVEKRGGYYEGSGALRDMIQNHLLQLVGLIAMEPPSSMDSESIRNETEKVFQSIRKMSEKDVHKSVIRGQYLSSTVKGEKMLGYREENGVNPESKTETYAALKFYIDNWRWGGIPFYIRTGKRLPTRVTEAVIHFKSTPHFLFQNKSINNGSNQLIIRIQPDEGILLKIGMKVPGGGFNVQTVNMDFHYSELAHQRVPSAYERLLLDSMLGDSTLFARGDAVMSAWEFLDPVLTAWKNDKSIPIYGYPCGTWGPEVADELIEKDGSTWRYPCKNLADDGIYCEL
ncbi:MAG: glucose-6-phosphate dehydrogenase [Bacteroidetes bacterium]|nr:glucose-6-phosphate dehydrogenase [Bacteroidota bacterium]MBU1114520.1 glucose-6-phosphate dehydrogenase [Bacteroidota bacterium]MBU1799704.1 glucose-6-phosphate dehydrogenase [Bacteroidota bacterium]